MLYLANPCGPDVIAAMHAGTIGLIDQPNQGKGPSVEAAHAGGVLWCADNGCFSDRWDEDRWWSFLLRNRHRSATCLFAVAPDVVGDAVATAERSAPWLPKIRALGYPVAFVAQDGSEAGDLIPWDLIDVLFIGGSTQWKLGPEARAVVAEAKRRGKHIHMGRVNSRERYEYARMIGCDSADGTFLTFGPDKNLRRLLRWVSGADQGYLFDLEEE